MTAVIILLTTSCKKDEPESRIPANAVYDFVTLVKSSEKGGSVFEMQKVGDSPIITYTSGYDLASASTHVSEGDRVIICYHPKEGPVYESGPITLYAYSTMSNTEQSLQYGIGADYDDWASGPFDIDAIWRSGTYINLQADIYGHQALRPQKFLLVADNATLDSAIPQLHMIYVEADRNKGENPYSVNASFDISEIWSKSQYDGVEIHFSTPKGEDKAIFIK